MPLTHFPNGVTGQQSSAVTSAAGSGDLDANLVYASTGSIQSVLATTVSAGTVTVTGSILGAGAKDSIMLVGATSASVLNQVLHWPYDVQITDVILGCTAAGSTATVILVTQGSAAADVIVAQTSAMVFASASGFQVVATVASVSATITQGTAPNNHAEVTLTGGGSTAANYNVTISFQRV